MCSVERLQQILRDASGDVTFKIVPGCQNEDRASKEVYFKCLYDYDPRADDMIPCQQAGLSFQCGDVLEVVCKADMHWWQARKVGTKNVGLVPSTELQEQRIRKMVIERNKGEGAITCLWPKKTNKKSKVNRYTARLNTAFDRLNLVTYEEVIQQKKTYHKTIVLIGAHGVGRRHIKNSLVSRFPEKYASPVPHTSRRQSPNEKHGELWFFETEDRMLKDIGSHQYLEYGKHDGHLYGTKLSSVQDLIKNDRTPVLDIETPALKILRCKEFFPYIIFVSSPISYPESGDPKMDASLQRLIADSTDLKNRYQHFFDYTVINETIDETVEKIVDHLEELAGSSAWIPASWYY
uniref:Peripheral plasma membrane protein CASK n=2 Tax=Clytia hemisphaerica TaxID=252671 RepID=A0A7M5VBE5_9CNID